VPWWHDSHERVLQKARALDWPSLLPGIEDQTCELVEPGCGGDSCTSDAIVSSRLD
jgi:hypothetical protein